ncbi:MAG: 16S rRNA (guanine(527)-N(7))-methyltransferase RsmG [Bacteroidota bacterium]
MEAILKYFTDFTPRQLEQFSLLEGLYKEWNEKINVISRKDIDHLYEKHVLHSLSIAAIFSFQPGMEVIDIGCGGGFPCVPLSILFPETTFNAVDSINKKLTVVKEVAAGAGITNIATRHTRAGDIKDQKFDVAISRAVAPLKDLLFWSKPILKKANPAKWGSKDGDLQVPSGLICLKGGDLAAEIHDSASKPKMWEISQLFKEPFFKEKYILQVN